MERLTDEIQIWPFAALKDKTEAVPGAFGTYDCFYAHAIAVTRLKQYEDAMPLERVQELAKAEKDGRLVVLDEPRKPLVWGDDKHDSVLCPNCNHDLMGGFLKTDSCEKPMYQCPYCGCSVDGTKALTREEAEAALKKRKNLPYDPLTLEELREMDGEPAYLPSGECWVLVTFNGFAAVFNWPDGSNCSAADWYNQIGPAYRRKPEEI